jgi:hypothetical protein
MIGTLAQRHTLPLMAPAAILTRVGGLHSTLGSPSFFRFGGQFAEEFRPRCIMNAFRKTMVMGHAVDMQVLYANDSEAVNDLSAFLVREVIPSESDTLMHASHSLAVFTTLGGTLGKLGMFALHLCQGLFFLAEEPGVGNLFTGGKCGKGCESYVNPYLFGASGQAFGVTLDRAASVPFSSRRAADGERFDLAAYRPMQHDLDVTNGTRVQFPLLINLETGLRVGQAVVAVMSFEAGIASGLTCLDSPKEGLHGEIKPYRDVLQDLGMNICQSRAFLFEDGECGLLLVEGEVLAFLLVGILALFKQVVIEPTTLFKGCVQLLCLPFCWVYPILKHFKHAQIIVQVLSCVVPPTAGGYPSPRLKPGAFRRFMVKWR